MEQYFFRPRQQVKSLLHEQVFFVPILTATRLYLNGSCGCYDNAVECYFCRFRGISHE